MGNEGEPVQSTKDWNLDGERSTLSSVMTKGRDRKSRRHHLTSCFFVSRLSSLHASEKTRRKRGLDRWQAEIPQSHSSRITTAKLIPPLSNCSTPSLQPSSKSSASPTALLGRKQRTASLVLPTPSPSTPRSSNASNALCSDSTRAGIAARLRACRSREFRRGSRRSVLWKAATGDVETSSSRREVSEAR